MLLLRPYGTKECFLGVCGEHVAELGVFGQETSTFLGVGIETAKVGLSLSETDLLRE
jgi:hypothetical protein